MRHRLVIGCKMDRGVTRKLLEAAIASGSCSNILVEDRASLLENDVGFCIMADA